MANILIVDDDSEIVECSRELLESSGHRVQTGRNGEEGLACLCAGQLPDCVLLDVDMPVMSGPRMAGHMLLHDAGEEKIPIVLVSARGDLAEVARHVGTPYFLAKASADYGDNLLKLLDRALRERRAPDPPRAAPGREEPPSAIRSPSNSFSM
jgi:CheY-like chemotaxis protein